MKCDLKRLNISSVMFCDWNLTWVMGIVCIREQKNAGQLDELYFQVDARNVPRWLKYSTTDYIRPIMGECSLFMRLYDERASNDVGDYQRFVADADCSETMERSFATIARNVGLLPSASVCNWHQP